MILKFVLTEHFQAIKKEGGKRCNVYFSLKYFHDQNTHSEGFEDIATFCPALSTIFLDTPEKEVLRLIPTFQSLKKLKFNKIEYEELLEILKKTKNKITSIDLVTCSGSLDIGGLSQMCPNLINLEIYYSKHVISKSPVQFLNVRKIVVYGTDISGDAANDILENSSNVEHITLNSASTLDYNRLLNILNRGSLAKVAELAIMSAPCLDLQCLELLIEKLPELQIVGRLEGWKVTSSQLEDLRKRVKKENYDLTLWYNLPLHVELGMDPDILDL